MTGKVFTSPAGTVPALITLLIFIVLLPLTAQDEETLGAAPGDQASFTAAVQSVFDQYSNAIVTGNMDAWIALWDEEGIQMPPGNPAVEGKDAIREHNMPLFADPMQDFSIEIEETMPLGDIGYARGTYSYPMPETGGQFNGKYLTVFQKQADGSWRIYRDCFNANSPPEE